MVHCVFKIFDYHLLPEQYRQLRITKAVSLSHQCQAQSNEIQSSTTPAQVPTACSISNTRYSVQVPLPSNIQPNQYHASNSTSTRWKYHFIVLPISSRLLAEMTASEVVSYTWPSSAPGTVSPCQGSTCSFESYMWFALVMASCCPFVAFCCCCICNKWYLNSGPFAGLTDDHICPRGEHNMLWSLANMPF